MFMRLGRRTIALHLADLWSCGVENYDGALGTEKLRTLQIGRVVFEYFVWSKGEQK